MRRPTRFEMNRYDTDDHSRRSVRLKEYDYASAGIYFVTICTYEKRCILGNVIAEKTSLSQTGAIVAKCWSRIPDHHPNVKLDEFVLMPNHVHGIIEIVGATHASPLRNRKKPGPPPASLGAIVGSFKSAVTKRVNETNNSPGASFWQRNYYERVIRNEKELKLIRQYIATNPLQWELDRENPQYKGKQDGDEITEFLKREDLARARHASPLRVNHKGKS